MITPPFQNPVFYSAILEKPAASILIGLVAESFKNSDDIAQLLLTSTDFENDITATVELQDGVRELTSLMVEIDEQIDTVVKYNPLFFPSKEDMFGVVERDEDGDIVAIAGFKSPFVVMSAKYSVPDHPNVVDAKVVHRQFEFPMEEALTKQPLLS